MTTTIATPPGLQPVLDLGHKLFSRSRGETVVVLCLSFLASITEGVSVLLVLPLLRLVGRSGTSAMLNVPTGFLPGRLGHYHVQIGLAQILVILVAATTLRAALGRAKDIRSTALMYDFVNALRNELFASVAQARWDALIIIRGSDINHALTADIDRVQAAVFNFIQLALTCVLILVYAVVSFVISVKMTILAVALCALSVIILYPFRKRAFQYGTTLSNQRRTQYRIVSDFLAGVKFAKSANAEPMYLSLLESTLEEMRSSTIAFAKAQGSGTLLFQLVSSIAVALFVYLSFAVYHVEYGAAIAMVILFLRLSPRFSMMQSSWQNILTNVPALDAMLAVQDYCTSNQEPTICDAGTPPKLLDSVRVEKIAFRYQSSEETLFDDLSFTIPANKITAIVGPSGAGKSTIADLLMGLLVPQRGQIVVDGVPLTGDRRRAWRSALAYVPQETFLLHDTIAANLAFPGSALEKDEIWAALKAANASRFVEALPDGLATVIGDHGVRLSGGERQRIALARALLRHPRLLLLDEATSALDWQSQAEIARAIQRLRGQMTVVTIAHRPSMIAFADWVVVIENGEVTESGDFQQLSKVRSSRLRQVVLMDQPGSARSAPAS